MTLTQIRNRVQTLQRRYALPLTVIRRPTPPSSAIVPTPPSSAPVAQDRKEPLPETHPFVIKLADAGIRLPTFGLLIHYFRRHREANTCPHPKSLVVALLPKPASRPIIDAIFQWDPPLQESVPIPAPSSPMLCFSPPLRSAQCATAT